MSSVCMFFFVRLVPNPVVLDLYGVTQADEVDFRPRGLAKRCKFHYLQGFCKILTYLRYKLQCFNFLCQSDSFKTLFGRSICWAPPISKLFLLARFVKIKETPLGSLLGRMARFQASCKLTNRMFLVLTLQFIQFFFRSNFDN